MHRKHFIDQLEHQGRILDVHFEGLTPAELLWRPAPDKWCAQEVLCHLYDEEREDFHARLHHVLTTPEQPLPPSNPLEWFKDRAYLEQDPNNVRKDLKEERKRSVEWLRSIQDGPWKNVHQHPKVGPITPELFLTNWVAHDLHHMRQLINLRYGYLASISAVSLDYAGKW